MQFSPSNILYLFVLFISRHNPQCEEFFIYMVVLQSDMQISSGINNTLPLAQELSQ